MKRHERMTAPRMLEVVYKRPNKPPRANARRNREPCRWGV